MGINVLLCDINFLLYFEVFVVLEVKDLWLVYERWNYYVKEVKFENIFFFGVNIVLR